MLKCYLPKNVLQEMVRAPGNLGSSPIFSNQQPQAVCPRECAKRSFDGVGHGQTTAEAVDRRIDHAVAPAAT